MKFAIAIIFALVGSMAFAQQVGKVCNNGDGTKVWGGDKCNDCPSDCAECVWKGSAASCIKCKSDNFYLKVDNEVGTCAKCVDNCNACKGGAAGDCVDTAADFKYNTAALVKCTTANCLYCKEENKCTKCNFGFFADNSSACVACGGEGCATCESAAKCTKCQYGYGLNNGTCAKCDMNLCNECPCKTCKTGSFFNNGSCIACADTSGYCTDCSGDKDKCKTCAPGSILKDNKCQACGAGCTACSEPGKCTACKDKFFLKDNTCTQCIGNCDKCSAADTCDTCTKGFYNAKDKKSCTQCPICKDNAQCSDGDGACSACNDGAYLSADKKCLPCAQANCAKCTDDKTCTACAFNALNVSSTCKTSTCTAGQQMNIEGKCDNGTLDNCVTGLNNTNTLSCVSCAKGYYFDGKACATCQPGCEVCLKVGDYLSCIQKGPKYFSVTTNTAGKKDNVAYQGKPGTATVTSTNKAAQCMPNWFLTQPLLEKTNTECNDFDTCQYPFKDFAGNWECYKDGKGNNGVKVAVSVFAMAVAALFAL